MIELTPLTKAFKGGGYDTNRTQSSMMAYSGLQYIRVVQLLNNPRRSGMSPPSNVLLPCLHQSLELLTKALILWSDQRTTPKSIGHETIKAMQKYAGQIPVFAGIVADSTKCAYLAVLQQGYTGVRYGECQIYFHKHDIEECIAMAIELINAYHDLSKIPMLPKHFPTRSKSI